MTTKKNRICIVILLAFIAAIRMILVISVLRNPKITIYGEELKKMELEYHLMNKITRNINHYKSQWSVNPLSCGDYLRIFLCLQECDPEMTIIEMSGKVKGYRVSIHGYLENYYVIYYLTESGDVQSNQFKAKYF